MWGAGGGGTAPGAVSERFAGPADLLARDPDEEAENRLRRAESIGRPVGGAAFLERIETTLGRTVKPRKRGPKPKGKPRAAA